MSYPSFICISHAVEDAAFAETFANELSACGFCCHRMDEHLPAETRQSALDACALLVVLLSTSTARAGTCMEDLTYRVSVGRPVLCVQLAESGLEAQLFSEMRLDAGDLLVYPMETASAPEGQAWLCHHLFVRHLCRYGTCFCDEKCVDALRGECIRCAVKAWRGHSRSQYLLSLTYARGGALPVMPAEARYWMEKAANGGDTDAMIDVGYLKLRGVGGPADAGAARGLFLRAAQQGNARGYEAYGLCCLYGYGMERDVPTAVRAFETALADGYASAGYRLGLIYRDGDGVYADAAKARAYLCAACRATGPLYGHRGFLARKGGRRVPFRGVPMHQMRNRFGDLWFGEDGRWKEDFRLASRVRTCMSVNRVRCVRYPEDAWLDGMELPTEETRREEEAIRRRMTWDVSVAEDALGTLLEKGDPARGVRPAPHAALIQYRRAVKQGNSDAMFHLGEAYLKGSGCPRDVAQAVRLFRRCAAWGNEKGRFALGVCYERGLGVPYDPAMALNWYGQAAAMGYAPAQNNLGGCYERGVGVSQDPVAAMEWYRRAADAGEPNALCRLGICYEQGMGVERREQLAIELYEQAARLDHPYALYRLGLCYHKGIGSEADLSEAVHLYECAARAGVADASYILALCYRFGWGVVRDQRAAFLRFSDAAQNGHVQSAYETGMCFLEGRGAVQSDSRAVEMFRRAVFLYDAWDGAVRHKLDQALPAGSLTARMAAGKAHYMLGYCTLYQRGIRRDDHRSQAIDEFSKAATMGDPAAMSALGDLYTYGAEEDGINEEMALCAYECAAQAAHPEALLSLSARDRARARACLDNRDAVGAAEAYEDSWKKLSRCAKQGSTEALLGLAASAYFGWGTEENYDTALWFLQRAQAREGYEADKDGRRLYGMEKSACLWMGDFYYAGWAGEPDLVAADAAYRYAASVSEREAEAACPPHVLRERWQVRVAYLQRVRAESLYRLAILRAVGFENDRRPQREEAFSFLCAAISAGHREALDDLARMYDYETRRTPPTTEPSGFHFPKWRKTEEENRANHDYLVWMTAYYAALRPTLDAFVLAPRPTPHPQAPAYVTATVTPIMRAAALNHIGDCYFDGIGLREDRSAAVACYREAADTVQPRGEAVAESVLWANYSLGWCLLHGEGVPKDPREGVRRLTKVANHHAEAAYALGMCYETGLGVDAENIREAVKYYRKANALGHRRATSHLKVLEARLR